MPISLDGSGSISGISTFSFSDEIIHTGDTNTAIKFPANDTISFETSGNERLRITSNGAVVIGNSSVTDGAHFQHYTSTARHQSFQSTNGDLAIVSDNNSNPVVYVKGTGTADLVNIFDNTTEVFTILDGGTVGINDSSPNTYFKLDVNGHTNIVGDVALPTTNRIYFGNSDTAFIKGEHGGSGYLAFGANNEKMRLTRTGYLGIGTDNPSRRLDLHESSSSGNFISITNDTTGHGAADGAIIGLQDDESLIISNKENNHIEFHTNNQERLRIESGGNIRTSSTVGHVLIGLDASRTINSHAPRLQITGTTYSHATVSVINNEANGNGAYLFLGKQRSGAVGGNTAVQANDIIGELRFPAGDGTDMNNYAARIMVHADQNASSNNTSGYIDFYTTRQNGSSEHKMRMTQNSNHSHLFSMGTGTSNLNNATTPDRTSVKIGGFLHLEGPFGHNSTPGMYYNCYSGGNDLFYRGTGVPSGGDRRPAAYGQKFGGHYFYGDNSSTAWSAQQQITSMQVNMNITSQGYVRKQYQPAFDAVRTAGTVPDSANQRIVFNSALTNVGGHYNTSNGYFTAPTAGTYFFSMHGMNNNQLAWYNFRKNNSVINPQHGAYMTNGSDWSAVSMTIVIVLAANDTIAVYTGSSNSVGMYGTGNNHNGFCGYMLG